MKQIEIRMLGRFEILVDGVADDRVTARGGKAAGVLQYLIMHAERPVSKPELISTFWANDEGGNPEIALKTMISRLRTLLNSMMDGLGGCITSRRGFYGWHSEDWVTVDLWTLEHLLNKIEDKEAPHWADRVNLRCQKAMTLYKGHLLASCAKVEWAQSYAYKLLNRYVDAVDDYCNRLFAEEKFETIVDVCQQFLLVDDMEDRIYLHYLRALFALGRYAEAKQIYQNVLYFHFRRLGDRPMEEIQALFADETAESGSLEDVSALLKQLHEDTDQSHALVCTYEQFRTLFNYQVRNLDRLSLTMVVGYITIKQVDGTPMDEQTQRAAMTDLMDFLGNHMRRSDVISQHGSNTVAVLLAPPGSLFDVMMDRLKRNYYRDESRAGYSLEYQYTNVGSQSESVVSSIARAVEANRQIHKKPRKPRGEA